MSFRAATMQDAAAIEHFLVGHADTSMFLRSNLRAWGPCGGAARNATRMWLQERRGAITGVLGHSTAGFALVQLPEGATPASLRQQLSGREINGIIGPSEQVHFARDALQLGAADTQLDDDEPLYSLDLADLEVPEGPVRLRAASRADRDLLVRWRRAYLVETIHFTESDAADLAGADIDGMLDRQSLMLLERPDGRPVAMTSFNAILPDMVQIGSVYTPKEARARGYARRAVASHLDRARRDGVKRAILFASGPAASRAYEAIGFRQIGKFTLLFFAEKQEVRVAA